MSEVYQNEHTCTPRQFIQALFNTQDDEVVYVGDLYGHKPGLLRSHGRAVYTSLSTYRLDDEGALKRQGSYLARTYLLVLDDIGTKYPAPDLPPTYVIESSAGNYQYGYAFDQGYDHGIIRALMARVKLLEIGDAGALKTNQVVRLPCGINGKTLEDGTVNRFPVRLVYWDPDTRYTPEALAVAWDLDKVDLTAAAHEPDSGMATLEQTQAWLDERAWLAERLVDIEPGKIHIDCPNAAAHSGDTGIKQTSVLLFEDGVHEYHCFHESCQSFDFEQWALGEVAGSLPVPPPEGVPTEELTGVPSGINWLLDNIVVIKGGNGGFYDLSEQELMRKGPFDVAYGHLTPNLPSTALRNANGKQVASSVGWEPVEERFITLEGKRVVNCYRPPQCERVEGRPELWFRLLKHIYGEHMDRVLDHLAFSLQQPRQKIRWQVLVVGAPRTGKTMTLRPVARILGNAYRSVTNEMMSHGWDDPFWQSKIIAVEEVYNNDKRFFNRLKARLTNDDVDHLNIKSQGTRTQRNLHSMYLFTNHDDALRFDENEDKLLVVRGPDTGLGKVFYDALAAACEDPVFIGQCYNHLLERDVSAFSHGALPVRTQALKDMCQAALPDYQAVLEEWHQVKQGSFAVPAVKLDTLKIELREAGYTGAGRKGIAKTLRRMGFVPAHGQAKVNGKNEQVYFWALSEQVAGRTPRELYQLCEGSGHLH